jgi:pimeloyl-ACP methyl ester carboxylesterase
LNHSRYYSWFGDQYVDSFALLSNDPEVDGAVVFIHGFMGDPHETWYAFQHMTISHATVQTFWSRQDLFFFSYRSFRNGIETSARSLMDFLNLIFPSPPTNILSILGYLRVPPSLASLDSPRRVYNRLVLVGHSEGGLVARKAAVLAEKKPCPISKARLVLFAPAISGVKPAGFKGMLMKSGPGNWIALPFLTKSFAYRDMTAPEFRNDVINDTLEARKDHADHTGLWAKVIFGSEEDVVTPVKWPGDDQVPEEVGQDHLSICKPTWMYDRPITFVAES